MIISQNIIVDVLICLYYIRGLLKTINMMSPWPAFFRTSCARWHARRRVAVGSVSDKTSIQIPMPLSFLMDLVKLYFVYIFTQYINSIVSDSCAVIIPLTGKGGECNALGIS
jgi:hypothetical protein